MKLWCGFTNFPLVLRVSWCNVFIVYPRSISSVHKFLSIWSLIRFRVFCFYSIIIFSHLWLLHFSIQNVVIFNPLGGDDENTYYEQYNTVCSGVIKTGDYVYVVTDGGKQMIAQVDSIWETKE